MSEEREHPEEGSEEHRGPPRGPRARLRGVARRILDEQPVNLSSRDARELVGAILGASDKARTEAIRLIGREVRTWLEGLGLAEGVHHLLTNYSLEVSASVSLKPLGEKLERPPSASRRASDEEAAG